MSADDRTPNMPLNKMMYTYYVPKSTFTLGLMYIIYTLYSTIQT